MEIDAAVDGPLWTMTLLLEVVETVVLVLVLLNNAVRYYTLQ